MDFEKLPRYLLYALGFYTIFFLWTLFYFFVPALAILADNAMLYIFLVVISLPWIFIALYFKGNIKFVEEHQIAMRLIIVGSISVASFLILFFLLSVL